MDHCITVDKQWYSYALIPFASISGKHSFHGGISGSQHMGRFACSEGEGWSLRRQVG